MRPVFLLGLFLLVTFVSVSKANETNGTQVEDGKEIAPNVDENADENADERPTRPRPNEGTQLLVSFSYQSSPIWVLFSARPNPGKGKKTKSKARAGPASRPERRPERRPPPKTKLDPKSKGANRRPLSKFYLTCLDEP